MPISSSLGRAIPIQMMPEKAPNMATASRHRIRSPVQKYDKTAVKKGDELKMIKKIPSGRYLTAMLKMMKLKVPMMLRVISVG